jgi:hypothetical protein
LPPAGGQRGGAEYALVIAAGHGAEAARVAKKRRPSAPAVGVGTIERTKSDRVVFTCPQELRREVAAYRRVQEGFPSESKVIVDLLWQALRRWREEQGQRRRPPPSGGHGGPE